MITTTVTPSSLIPINSLISTYTLDMKQYVQKDYAQKNQRKGLERPTFCNKLDEIDGEVSEIYSHLYILKYQSMAAAIL